MSINLIESGHRTQKPLGGTLVSAAVHACLITLAVYASASAVERPTDYVDRIDVWPIATSTTAHTSTQREHRAAAARPQRAPDVARAPIAIPSTIPTTLPPIDTSRPVLSDSMLFGSAPGGSSVSGSDTSAEPGRAGEPLFAAQVEKPAMPRAGNPAPRYPSLLESSRVEGTVLVQFVVDTLGIVDMRTFRVLESSNELFAESTRASLAKWRFAPAEAGGRRVKQIVQLPLRFVAPRR